MFSKSLFYISKLKSNCKRVSLYVNKYYYFGNEEPKSNRTYYIEEELSHKELESYKRFDKFIQIKFKLSWNHVQSLFRQKKLTALTKNGEIISNDKNYILKPGDRIKFPKNLDPQLEKGRTEIGRKEREDDNKIDVSASSLFKEMIIYENEDFIAINKLPNISSQGGAEVKLNLSTLSKYYINEIYNKESAKRDNDQESAKIVHRLDKNTTGIMLIAKSKQFSSEFSQALRERKNIEKKYIGVVEGLPVNLQNQIRKMKNNTKIKLDLNGFVNASLGYDNKQMKAVLDQENTGNKSTNTHFECILVTKWESRDPNGKPECLILDENLFNSSDSDFKIRQFFQNYSEENSKFIYHTVIRYKIEGGKKHQIRAHSSLVLGTPILMDLKYDYKSDFNIWDFYLTKQNEKFIYDDNKVSINSQNLKKSSAPENTLYQESEKHYIRSIINKELVFLHSRELSFSLGGVNYSFKADFPHHFQFYLSYILREKKDLIVSLL